MNNLKYIQIKKGAYNMSKQPEFYGTPESNKKETQEKKDLKDYGFILLITPIVSTILIWFWIGSMNLLQGPGSKLTGLVAVTIIITAITAAMEVSAFQKTSQQKVG